MPHLWPRSLLAALFTSIVGLLLGVLSALAQIQPPEPGLPDVGDLSLAVNAGTTLIGMTVHVPQPGTNTVFLYVLPIGGTAAAADVAVTLSVNGRSVPLTFCSRSCRTADVNLLGGDDLEVGVQDTLMAATASFQIPQLPLQDGSELLGLGQDRMHSLHSYRIEESLGPADPPIQTHYTAVSPGQTSIEASNGFEMTWIGTLRYSRNGSTQPWSVDDVGITLPVPSFVWDPQRGAAFVSPQIIGADTIDGQDTQIVAFYLPLGHSPFWFRLWVDGTGLVLKAEMRGQGHFMDQHFTDFDAPLTVWPPTD